MARRTKQRVPVLSAREAVGLIPDGATLYLDGTSTGIREPSLLFEALAERFGKTGAPRDLTLFFPNGVGDRDPNSKRGYSVLALPGMVKRLVGGHLGQSPRLSAMADRNEVEAYNLSMGVMSQMMRAAACRLPGVISRVGLHTFQDPRQKGCKLNARTTEDVVSLMHINGEEFLFYKTLAPTVALLRGSTADEDGYVTMEDEIGAAFLDELAVAQAVRNNGGVVIVQVQRLVKAGSLPPKQVKIPGIYVDAVVVDSLQWQSYAESARPTNRIAAGEYAAPDVVLDPLPLDARKVVNRRSLFEIRAGDIGNIGAGIQTGISAVAQEEGVADMVTFTTECGTIGGQSGRPEGSNFGTFTNMRAVIPMPDQFNFYDGGGLDLALLSFAQVDLLGNVNVHRLDGKIMGTGGFINISANSRKIVFGGTMTSGGFKARVGDGRIVVEQEGRHRKFVTQVDEVSFCGPEAARRGANVLYVTERCVFRLTQEGLELVELAPGMRVETDILPLMAFTPRISPHLKIMETRLFEQGVMGLKAYIT